MKKIIQLILASILLAFTGIAFSSCDYDNWEPENNVLTDASHGSLTNHYVVATGEAINITQSSATILFSANYNYKDALKIETGILYSTSAFNGWEADASKQDFVKLTNFTKSDNELTLTNLKPLTTYYYCAYAETDNGRENHHGDIKSFTTAADYSAGEPVDLGLSVKWANHNIGASHPEDSGVSFYWGGTKASENNTKPDWHDFALSTLQNKGYIDSNNNLCPAYDAATQIWGNQWRMPTKAEFQELIIKCTWKKTTKDGKNVYLITGPNSKFIYLPCLSHWTSTGSSSNAYMFYCSSSYPYSYEVASYLRLYENSIRPVQK